MSSPYEDEATRLLEGRRERLKELEARAPKEKGFFRKRRLARELRMVQEDITYLEEDIKRYKRGVGWNRKTFIDTLGTEAESH